MRLKLVLALATAALAAPGQAEWLKASSRHFVIYSDADVAAATELATKLENLDGALRAVSGIPDTPESAANPVTVYVVDNLSAIRKLSRRSDVAGFYIPRADGAVAFTPRRGEGAGAVALTPQIVLFHEYAHHFMLSNASTAYPAWLSEGYAEFVSTATLNDRGVMIGHGANHRAYELALAMRTPLSLLFAPRAKLTVEQQSQIYGRGWALTHYLLLNPDRRKQLDKYLVAINSGVAPLKAATDSFGNLRDLERALDKYVLGKSLAAFVIGKERLPAVKVEVRPLTPGERALVDMRMVSTRGVDQKEATTVYARAVQAAKPFPGDATAQGWLAEMAYDAKRDDEAEAAADRALAADPKSVQALLLKARVRLRRAEAAGTTDQKIWAEARSWIIKANRVNSDGAAALQLFYDSFEMADAKPSASAVAGIHRALELAPQDPGLRFRSARQHLMDGKLTEAKRALRPLAYNPHAPADNPAVRLIAMIDGGVTGQALLDALAGPGGESQDAGN